MFRPSSTARLLRQSSRTSRIPFKSQASRRFLSTEPPHKASRSWKNSAARWAIAAGGVYWYNTTPLFAEKPQYTIQDQEAPLPTLESLSRSSRFALPSEEDPPVLPVQPTSISPPSIDPKSPLPSNLDAPTQDPGDLESEAASQGAFNEETGEINWDCPCLGGMAHGPCGEEFRAAFSCFVFSKEEPKGMDCVEKFKGMQTCFRAHPEEYGDQLEDDEEEVERELLARESQDAGDNVGGDATQNVMNTSNEDAGQRITSKTDTGADKVLNSSTSSPQSEGQSTKKPIYDSASDSKISGSEPGLKTAEDSKESLGSTSKISRGVAGDEGGDLVPKAAHDATTPAVGQK